MLIQTCCEDNPQLETIYIYIFISLHVHFTSLLVLFHFVSCALSFYFTFAYIYIRTLKINFWLTKVATSYINKIDKQIHVLINRIKLVFTYLEKP